MADYSSVLAALADFRTDVARSRQSAPAAFSLTQSLLSAAPGIASVARRAFSAFATAHNNIHATGIGLRQRGGKYIQDEFVLKIFVFDKFASVPADAIFSIYRNLAVDVESLPIQVIRQNPPSSDDDFLAALAPFQNPPAPVAPVPPAAPIAAAAPSPKVRFDPIPAGVSISPLNAPFVGTLGCFLKRKLVDTEELFVLSNNHVLANVDTLPVGTPIVQPGPEQPPFTTKASDVFAALHTAVPIQFPGPNMSAPANRFDAAIANVTNGARAQIGTMFGGLLYQPGKVTAPKPGMRVMKAGRTTGVTHGTITATHVQGLQVNYATFPASRIATYADTIRIVGDQGNPFSLPGDSGSVILEEQTGNPVALLFAGDGQATSAFDLGPICEFFNAWPV